MPARYIAAALLTLALTANARAQLDQGGTDEAVRVTVAQNQDGSRTSYEYDRANRKAVATTTGSNGKLLSKIRYDLDEQGRFAAGEIYDAKDQLRFRTQYKYDGNGRLESETQLTKEGAVRHKLVYSYDKFGKQTGYEIYDAQGKLLGRTKK